MLILCGASAWAQDEAAPRFRFTQFDNPPAQQQQPQKQLYFTQFQKPAVNAPVQPPAEMPPVDKPQPAEKIVLKKPQSPPVVVPGKGVAPVPAEKALPSTQIKEAPIAAGDQFSIAQALRLAYINNPSLNSARSRLLATQEALPQAQAGYKPTIDANADVTHLNSDSADGTSKNIGLNLSEPLYRGGRTMAQMAAARAVIEANTESLRAQEQSVFEAAVTAYMDVVRDGAVLDLRRQNQELLARQLKATRDRFEVGELTKTDVSQSEARLAGAEADVIDAQGTLNTTRAVFEQVVGAPPGQLLPPDIQLQLPSTLDDAVQTADTYSPVVLSAISAHEAAEKDIDDVYGELLPQVLFVTGVGKTYDPPTGTRNSDTSTSIGVQATIPLYEAGAVRSRVRAAKHTANSRYLDILDIKRQVRENAVRAWEEWQATRAQIKSREAQVEAARVAQEGVRQEAEFGSRSILDALDADQEFLDAQVALVSARRDEVVAQYSLMATLGMLTPETLGFSADKIDSKDNLKQIQGKIFDMGVDRLPNKR